MKKFLTVVLAAIMVMTLLAGCGGELFDPSELQRQINEQAEKIAELEQQADKIKELEAEIDRLYGQYDWDNPIVIENEAEAEELFILHRDNRAEFNKKYIGRVFQITGTVDNTFSAAGNRYNSPGVTFGNEYYRTHWIFFNSRPKIEQRVTVAGVYTALEDSWLIFDACRVIEVL